MNKAWEWLKKYGVVISLLQAVLWPIGIVMTSTQNWTDVTITAEDAFVNDVIGTWFFNQHLYGYRSLDECEYENSGDDPFRQFTHDDSEPCDQLGVMDAEYEIILKSALTHNLLDFSTDPETLQMIREKLYWYVDESDLCCDDWSVPEYPKSVRAILTE